MSCREQTTKKYTTRPSPPYAANTPACRGKIRVGNDGRKWTSTRVKGGVYRWTVVKIQFNLHPYTNRLFFSTLQTICTLEAVKNKTWPQLHRARRCGIWPRWKTAALGLCMSRSCSLAKGLLIR